MGRRLHIVTKKVIESKETPYLNFKSGEFKNLLEELGCDVFVQANEDWSNITMEVTKESFDKAVRIIRSASVEENEYVMDAINECDMTLEQARECLDQCKKESDHHSGYYTFWFY